MKRPIRRRAAMLATSLVAILASVFTASSALAATAMLDTFNNPGSWFTTGVGTGFAGVVQNAAPGTVPGQGGMATIRSNGTGFSSVGRTVTLTPADHCHASVQLAAGGGAVTVNVEVINPSNWRYLSLRTLTMPAYDPWGKVSFTLDPSWGTVVFRVSAVGGSTAWPRTAYVDNLVINCHDTPDIG